jgi:AcrR family transcriptional regulator
MKIISDQDSLVMNMRIRLTPDETRERILEVAEEHFRRVGYAKTAVADIAAVLGMSPANVYRFFPSKSAINEAIARRLLAQSHALARAIVAEDRPVAERLEALVLALHRYNKSQYVAERRLHDMVEVAMAENWPIVEAHFAEVVSIFATLIADGVARGEFAPCDPQEAATLVKHCFACVLHPSLIAQCADQDLEALTIGLARLVVAALKGGAPPALALKQPT